LLEVYGTVELQVSLESLTLMEICSSHEFQASEEEEIHLYKLLPIIVYPYHLKKFKQ
jgi:hypothetical protein